MPEYKIKFDTVKINNVFKCRAIIINEFNQEYYGTGNTPKEALFNAIEIYSETDPIWNMYSDEIF